MQKICRGAFFGKVADPQPAIFSKNVLHWKYHLISLCTI